MKQKRTSSVHRSNARAEQASVKKTPPANAKGIIPERSGVFFLIPVLVYVFLVFTPSLHNEFIRTWDDNHYITSNPLIFSLDWASIKAMFTTQVNSSYVPLPLLSFAIEYSLFKFNSFPYHLTNLFLHLFNVVLCYFFFRKLNLQSLFAILGVLIFAVHPMRVESVAWITERKDLLYTFFYLLSLIAYIKYLKVKNKSSVFYALSFMFFILALFSKIQAVALPFSLFVLDYFFKRKITVKTLLEKVPFIFFALAIGIVGIIILRNEGTLGTNEFHSFTDRIFFGFYSLSAYLLKFIAPLKLCLLYPYPSKTGSFLPVLYYLSPLFILSILLLVYTIRKNRSVFIFGLLFFLVNIMFLLQVFGAGYAFMCDRYSYIPHIGLSFLAAWFVSDLFINRDKTRFLILGIIIVLISADSVITYNRCFVWKNSATVWSDVADKYPSLHISYKNRATYYTEHGSNELALNDLLYLERLNSPDAEVYSNLSYQYGMLDNPEKSIQASTKAISLDSNVYSSYLNRGITYAKTKQFDLAIKDFTKALQLKPNDPEILRNRAYSNLEMGNYKSAINDYNQVIIILKADDDLYLKRGLAWYKLNEPAEAMKDFRQCIHINPKNSQAAMNLSVMYSSVQKNDSALFYALQSKSAGGNVNEEYLKSLQIKTRLR